MQPSTPPPGSKTCVICGMEIPERARKCTHCDQWQGSTARLFSVHLRDLVTLLPILTLCIAFLGQLDLFWRPDLDAFGIRCTAANSSGELRRYEGQTLILTARNEPAFPGQGNPERGRRNTAFYAANGIQ